MRASGSSFGASLSVCFSALILAVGCSSAPTPGAVTSSAAAGAALISRPSSSEAANVRSFVALSGAGGATAAPVSSVGECSSPDFSPDGERAVYLCRNRPQHRNAQVYEMHFRSRLERRVTFHDGEDASPSYRPDGARILYASATDEIKEEPHLSRSLKEKFAADADADADAAAAPGSATRPGAASESRPVALPSLAPLELYVASPEGSEIRRLTRSPGYDSEARFDPSGRKIAFASTRATRGMRAQIYAQIYAMSADGSGARLISSALDDDASPAFSPDGKRLAFVRKASDSSVAHVYVVDLRPGAKPRALTAFPALSLWPVWHPNGRDVIFASNRADRKGFDLWAVGEDASCLRRLTDAEGDETQPAISRDGARLLFARERQGAKHVFAMPYAPPAKCSSEAP